MSCFSVLATMLIQSQSLCICVCVCVRARALKLENLMRKKHICTIQCVYYDDDDDVVCMCSSNFSGRLSSIGWLVGVILTKGQRRTWLLWLPWNKMATLLNVLCIKLLYLHQNVGLSTSMAYLWSTNNGQASWTINEYQRHWQGTKTASGKIANCFYSSSSYYSSYSC